VCETVAYRGEGGAAVDLERLAITALRDGTRPRVTGPCSGTLPQQILHQGYVSQPTVSLTASMETAALYATGGRSRQDGVVLTVDLTALRAHTRVFSGVRTLQRHSEEWLRDSTVASLRGVLHTLGLRAGGRFLEGCFAETRGHAERNQWRVPRVDEEMAWEKYLSESELGRLRQVDPDDLRAILQDFETYWDLALEHVAGTTKIDVSTGKATTRSLLREPFMYQRVFDRALPMLTTNADAPRGEHRIGWDQTAFGYIAKTILDLELFPAGRVPASCLVRAAIVDRDGREVATFTPDGQQGRVVA
jgi:hypothetical protein